MTEENQTQVEKKNKVVLVTGCSSGFGIYISARLASKGYQVISTLRNLYRQDDLLNAVKERGGEVTVMPLDVNAQYTIDDCILQIKQKFGRIDVLVNNAGYGIGGFFEDLTDEEIRRQMDTNFFGVQNVTRRVLPLMREQEEGKIINISSVSGFSSQPAFSAYSASKWALEAFSESLHYEVEPFGIKVLLIEPGTYKTRIFFENAKFAKFFDDPQSPYYDRSQKLKEKVKGYVSNCKKDPEDIARLVQKLIESPNPPFRSVPDKEANALRFFRRILPFGLYKKMIKKALSE